MHTQQPQQGEKKLSVVGVFFSPWTYHSRPLTFFLPVPSRMAGCCQTWAAKLMELWVMAGALTMMAHFSVAISLQVDFPELLQDSTLRGKTNVTSVMSCIARY